MEKKVAAVLMIVCLIFGGLESVEPSAADCLDACTTACVNPNERLRQRCEIKCRIKCDSGNFSLCNFFPLRFV
ncbi:hypothetical protein JCGZ_22048 [Jatropha curcas]|uniref:Thionin-like protein n=1 Tax=Jatropha curcas TaxID=180498 RepID=A0A067LK01_JATCU|nr:hypothetical protein JCGZ_22048 [Jatropha curcas]